MTAPKAATATCKVPLPDGRLVGIQAKALPLGGTLNWEKIERLKLEFSSSSGELRNALVSARMTEPRHDPRQRVTITPEARFPADALPLSSFAAIVADRATRGLLPSLFPFADLRVIALGVSADWLAGNIQPLPLPLHRQCLEALVAADNLGAAQILLPPAPDDACQVLHQAIMATHPETTLREVTDLPGLYGHPPLRQNQLGHQRVWFPVLGSKESDDRLLDVEIVLQPLTQRQSKGSEALHIIGLPENAQSEKEKIDRLLHVMRELDAHGLGEWRTLVRLPRHFQGESYGLALAQADRIARGREFPGAGHIIASGAIAIDDEQGKPGSVLDVEGIERKCAVILGGLSTKGGRVLLPAAWQRKVPNDFQRQVEKKGGSCAFIERLF